MRTSNYRKRIKLSKKTAKILAGSLGGLLLAGTIAFFLYFRVEHVEVMVSDRYTADEVKEMVLRGPLASNSLLAPLLYSSQVEGVPFVEGFEVKQVNRNTIAIGVQEKQPVGCIPFLDCYMYFDRTGNIIESSTERDEKIPYFEGLDIDHVVVNEELAIKEGSVLNTAVSLARIFEKNDLIPDHIHFDEKYQITLEYGEIEVRLGTDSFLEDKMSRLIAILPKIRGQKGILHMESVNGTVKTITFEKEKMIQIPILDSDGDPVLDANGQPTYREVPASEMEAEKENGTETEGSSEESDDSQTGTYGEEDGYQEEADSQWEDGTEDTGQSGQSEEGGNQEENLYGEEDSYGEDGSYDEGVSYEEDTLEEEETDPEADEWVPEIETWSSSPLENEENY